MPDTSHLAEYQWKPGQSGNPAGRPKKKPFAAMVEEVLQKNPELMKQIVEATIGKAMEGDIQAIKELADRTDGKVAQQIQHTGADDEDGLPTAIEIVVKDVKAKD